MWGILLESDDATRPPIFVRPSAKQLIFIRGPEGGDRQVFGKHDGDSISNEDKALLDGEDGWVSGQTRASDMMYKHLDSRVVSREHARLFWRLRSDGTTNVWCPVLADQGSTHGTTIRSGGDKKQVKLASGRPVSLEDGDRIVFGRKVEKGGEAFFPPVLKVRFAFTRPQELGDEQKETKPVAPVDSTMMLSVSQVGHRLQESDGEHGDDYVQAVVEVDEHEDDAYCSDLDHEEYERMVNEAENEEDKYAQELDNDLFEDGVSLTTPLHCKEEVHSTADWAIRAFSVSDDSNSGDEWKDDEVHLSDSDISRDSLVNHPSQRTSLSASSEERDTPSTSDVDDDVVCASSKEKKIIDADPFPRALYLSTSDGEDVPNEIAQSQSLFEHAEKAAEHIIEASEQALNVAEQMKPTTDKLASCLEQPSSSTPEALESDTSSHVQDQAPPEQKASRKRNADEAELESPASSSLSLTEGVTRSCPAPHRADKRSKLNFRTGMFAGVVTGVVCTFVGLSSLALSENFLV